MSKPALTVARFNELVLARFAALVAALLANAWPVASPWWTATFTRFLRAGVRQLVARVGRRGGKSSFACIFAVAFALVYMTLGLVPPGDTGWVVFISVNIAEAGQRLRTIAKILTVVGVLHSVEGDTILLTGSNIGFRVQASTIASVSGWTTILVVADEVAKMRDAATGANPAAEVLAALRPTLATQPLGRIMLLSSPLGVEDAHAVAFDLGDNDFQVTAFAESWVANESLTEAQCRELEPDSRLFDREYGARPGQLVAATFGEHLIVPCFEPPPYRYAPMSRPIVLSDPSGLKGRDRWTAATAQWCQRVVTDEEKLEWVVKKDQRGNPIPGERVPKRDEHGGLVLAKLDAMPQPFLLVSRLGSWANAFSSSVSGSHVCMCLATTARSIGAVGVVVDQYASVLVESELARHGAPYRSFSHTNTSKSEGVVWITRLMREGRLKILDEANPANVESFRSELRSFQTKLGNGIERFEAKSGRHDDWPALLLLAHRASDDGLFGLEAPLERQTVSIIGNHAA